MSYDLSKDSLGKEPFVMVGLVMDKCSLVSGSAPCTSNKTGDSKCFNTYSSCKDLPNFTKTTTEILFCEPRSNLPIGVNLLPALKGKPKKASTNITGGKGIGDRAVVTVSIKDFTHHDRGIDPYYSERTYNAEERGTFWGKFLKRNPYYEGRTLRIYYGFLNDPFSMGDFVTQDYDITDISGPTNGVITITAKDILIRTYESKNKYPRLSNGELSADIAISAATATLLPAGIGDSDYPASGYVSIGKDIKQFTRVGDVLTFVAHGAWGTEDKSHKAGDIVQICKSWSSINIIDVLYDLLFDGAQLPADYLPYATNWTDEKTLWMNSSTVTGILAKPEDISKVIAELSEQFMFDLWWDATDKKVYIKALSPEIYNESTPTLTDDYNILENSLKIKRDTKQRISEIQIWYSKINYIEADNPENFASGIIKADVSRAGSDRYGQNAIKIIHSRWIVDSGQALQLAGRLLARFADTPEVITFDLAVKDDSLLSLGSIVNMSSWQFQDFTGANLEKKFQVTQIDEVDQGHSIRVSALTSYFSGRYGLVAPDATPNYTPASAVEKGKYVFICYDNGEFLDEEYAYKIL